MPSFEDEPLLISLSSLYSIILSPTSLSPSSRTFPLPVPLLLLFKKYRSCLPFLKSPQITSLFSSLCFVLRCTSSPFEHPSSISFTSTTLPALFISHNNSHLAIALFEGLYSFHHPISSFSKNSMACCLSFPTYLS